jgi:hypothetical protein
MKDEQVDLDDLRNYVYIPFLEYWEKKMINSEKTCTSRVKQYGKVGSRFKIFSTVFEITDIKKLKLEIVKDKYYKQEGCDSKEKFETIWNNIHYKKGFDKNQEVFIHFFSKVGQT